MGTIYKISNDINDKLYIGQTIQELRYRWAEHKRDAKKLERPLYRSMRKYGLDHFFIEAIELNVPKEKLDEREIYWIAYYDSFNNGYNLTPGGNPGVLNGIKVYQYDLQGSFLKEFDSACEAERETGCLHQNILKVCKGILCRCGEYLWSFEKVDHLVQRSSKREKQVKQLDENHQVICVWPSLVEAAKAMGVEGTHISRACRTKYKCHGYYWEKV